MKAIEQVERSSQVFSYMDLEDNISPVRGHICIIFILGHN